VHCWALLAVVFGVGFEELDLDERDDADSEFPVMVKSTRSKQKSATVRSRLRIRTRLRLAVHRVWPPKPKPLILMYHRIADVPIDPWDLAVSPFNFEEHLQLLKRTRSPLPLTDFVHKLLTATLPPNAVALTFDDGYVDNLVAGKPRLTTADVPATVFLATGYLNCAEEYWWDELARLILSESGPQRFELVVRGKALRLDLGTEPTAREDGTKRAASLSKRRAALRTLYQALQPLDEEERRPFVAKLRSMFARRNDDARLGRAMSSEEVRALITDGLVTIGAHTLTHPMLSVLGAAACHREISESRRACETLSGAPVAAFAYPYGDFDEEAREAVRAAGFAFACSTRIGPVMGTSDLFALPRFQVPNVGGDALELALRSASAPN
jgi:peptidoglycan/xylan/chitin deacetylase (PgdA/CDA1 family)